MKNSFNFLKSCLKVVAPIFFLLVTLVSCFGSKKEKDNEFEVSAKSITWAERLGFPADKRIIIYHADDFGMCEEANAAIIKLFENNDIQSAASMAPCPAYAESIEWAKANPNYDIGIHLTLTNEWKSHNWGTVANPSDVPSLLNPEGNMWKRVEEVVANASPEEVEIELRAQIEKTIAMGYRPSHMDTHMGTLFGSNDFTEIFFKLAEEYRIPANVIDFSDPKVVMGFKKMGYPITKRLKKMVADYSLPKLDNFSSVPKGKTYEELREKFFHQAKSLKPGLTEIIFHPQVATEHSKTITGSWQQRAWELELFADPVVKKFFEDEGIVLTNWKEIMERFENL
ncbi:MAG: polysaccharide deacetylase family protein [Cyclobacteriaceae bacterium]